MVLFFGARLGAQPQQDMSDIVSSESILQNVIKAADTLILGSAIFLWGISESPRILGFYAGLDTLRSKLGPYLPLDLSYFKQIELSLGLMKTDKERSAKVYSIDDCVADIAKIVNAYKEVGSVTFGRFNLSFDRNKEIKKNILEALVQKYELCLPENLNKENWVKLGDKGLDLLQFRDLSKRYKGSLELDNAYFYLESRSQM